MVTKIEPSVVGVENGLTSIQLIHNSGLDLVVKFAYNHLDYDLGVEVYKLKDGKIDHDNRLLPKNLESENAKYGYMGDNLVNEVIRLVNDIYEYNNS